ncbi:MAG: phenylalanine--tRNA ligase subunit beta [Desulfovibrionaceae bacterium]
MLLSLKWLRECVPFEGTAEALGERLTMLGLELEDVLKPYDAIQTIVVGHVVACAKHPEADKLSVCKVDVGQSEALDIVCGAPNVALGQKVPVALVGCTMPDGMVIKKAKLRGMPSHGMICSERELGLTEDHSGIMVLPQESPVGQKLVEVLDLDREVLDISITPNRADCLSVIGLARETAMAFRLPFTLPTFTLQEHGADASHAIPIEIANPELCWLYQGKILENIQVKPSPAWLRYRLQAVGVRAISNIVDVTNYVLMECGQPFHAFDKDTLAGGRIIVAPARAGEKLITLDGQERVLNAEDLCVRDAQHPVALAGVMGGLRTEITASTKSVFLESAIFRPASIRKTARRLGLSSESSYRFERGVDQQANTWIMNRAAALMAELSGATVRPGVCRAEPRPHVAAPIPFRPAKADALLGVSLSPDFDKDCLTRLGCTVQEQAESWQVTPPAWRHDLSREADLIEEVGRIYGLDRIEPALPPIVRRLDATAQAESRFAFCARLKRWGMGLGLNEAVNYSFVGHKDLDHLGLPTAPRISILNPLSAEQDVLRTQIAPGLLQNLRHNVAQGASGVRLFEVAHIFEADASSETSARETAHLAVLMYGDRFDSMWPHPTGEGTSADYTDLKGVVEHLFTTLHVPAPHCVPTSAHTFLSPCVRVQVLGQDVGCMGRVKPDIADAYHARKDVWLAELDVDVLHCLHSARQIRFRALPVYPPVRRDITVMAGAGISVDAVLAQVRGLKQNLLQEIVLVDLFEPEHSQERNMTFRLTFRHADRTLKDSEVDKERAKVADALVRDLGVRV